MFKEYGSRTLYPPGGTLKKKEMTSSSSELATGETTKKEGAGAGGSGGGGGGGGAMAMKQRRRFSLQSPVNFINKMGRKLSVGSRSGLSSRSSSGSGSLNNLSDQYLVDGQLFGGSGSGGGERMGRSRWRQQRQVASSAHNSEEELNRQFADFDTYLGGYDDGPSPSSSRASSAVAAAAVASAAMSVPIILLQSTTDDEGEESNGEGGGGRQRSRSETRPPSHFSRFLKFSRRRTSQSENPSPTSVTQSLEFPAGMTYERRGSLGTLGIATPILKCSLEQLPEGVQVHHATRTCSPSPILSPEPGATLEFHSWSSLSSPDSDVDPETATNTTTTSAQKSADRSSLFQSLKPTVAKFRDRSATFSSDNRRSPSGGGAKSATASSSSTEMLRPVQRERSVSFSITQAGGPLLSPSPTPNDERTKKRRSLGYIFWPAFSRSR